MIKVTLEFKDTAELLAYFSAPKAAAPGAAFPPIQVEGTVEPVAKPKPAPKPKAEPATTAAASQPAPAASVATASAEPAGEAPAPATAAPKVDYPMLQKAVFALAAARNKKGLDKEPMLAIAKGLGGATFKEVPAEKWAEALAKVNAQLAEVEALEAEVA